MAGGASFVTRWGCGALAHPCRRYAYPSAALRRIVPRVRGSKCLLRLRFFWRFAVRMGTRSNRTSSQPYLR